MKCSTVAAQAYVQTHGAPEARGTASPAIKALWSRLQKAEPVTGANGTSKGEYVLVEKTDEEESDWRHMRDRLYAALRPYQKRLTPKTFRVRMTVRAAENHIVLWKEPIMADAPVVAERTEQTTEKPAVVHPAARPRASVPHLAHAAAR